MNTETGLKNNEIRKLLADEKARLWKVIYETTKLTVLMACAGSVETLFNTGQITDETRQEYFTAIMDRLTEIPKEDFRY